MNLKLDFKLARVLSSQENQNINCLIHATNPEGLENILKTYKVTITGKFPFINAFAISCSRNEILKLSTIKQVEFLSSQPKVFAMMNIAKKILGVENLGKGKGQTIAYIDTGVMPHLDFTLGNNRIKKFVDLINFKVFPYDDNGHGTFVAGVGSGSGALSLGRFSGICPESEIVAIKALDSNGEANATSILEAMQWVYDNAKTFNINVVCMSFGSEPLGENDPILQGAEKLWDSGLVVVAAAGNSGPEYQTIKSPGISSKIITVGGLDDNRIDENSFNPALFEIADFSSRGPALNTFKPDIIAPSVDITSCGITAPYAKLSGTSVSAPMVAGLCALILEKQPSLSPIEVKEEIIKHSMPITFNKNKEGFGYVTFS